MSRQIRISRSENMPLKEKLRRFSWLFFSLMIIILALSVITLYSAGTADCSGAVGTCGKFGAWRPYALAQMGRIAIGLSVFFIAAFSDIKLWLRSSYWLYAGALFLIMLVTFIGHSGMGAQRWLNLGFVSIQPSEFIKVGLVLVLARYFSWQNSFELEQFKNYLLPAAFVAFPFLLILLQPDLGTALSIAFISAGFFFIAGAKRQWFAIGAVLFAITAPVIWTVGLQGYQKQRITTFINPSRDLSGAGYQINQAKIAFGSGGIVGKGYLQGTQSQLSFLPEKHTDFIFTMFGEELGFIGGFVLIALYSIMVGIMLWWSKTTRNRFGQLVCFGFCLNFFIYYFINIAMVLGLMPTVGVPLPLMSFGGSSLLALMFGLGLVQNARIYRDVQLSAKGG
ncbi:MAG: rod shape-determining protein RodA [Alphaproteobacteria bacterium]|nr:rod shape-determining protein RodA [Alphaproteobacteria bacterium]